MAKQCISPFLFLKLWLYLRAEQKKRLVALIFLIIIVSIVEMLSIGSVIPFLGVLTNPNFIRDAPVGKIVLSLFNISEVEKSIYYLTAIFLLCIAMATSLRMFLVWFSNNLAFNIGAELSAEVFRKTIYQPYITHLNRNTSEVISGIVAKVHEVLYNVIVPVITLISSIIMIAIIFFGLIAIDFKITISIFLVFGFIYSIVAFFAKGRLLRNSGDISLQSVRVIKALQESLGGIRDILIDGTQELFCELYEKADGSLRKAQKDNQISSQYPRYLIEFVGVVLIVVLAYALIVKGDEEARLLAIPMLGLIALAAQRLMPIFQQSYAAWSNLRGATSSLEDVLNFLSQRVPEVPNVDASFKDIFRFRLEFRDLGFRYSETGPWIFRHLNIVIERGEHIGIVGPTGSGKSTFVDVLMGLLEPSEGAILIDGMPVDRAAFVLWQRNISHVPQQVFLTDSSIASNIAFGCKENMVNFSRIEKSAIQAQIAEFIETLPMGYNTPVGERGVRLSGGQRQRIGIARALYKEAQVIIFDEATSALDGATEELLIRSVNGLSKQLTIFMIAHRLTTLAGCSRIISFDGKGSIEIVNYPQLPPQ